MESDRDKIKAGFPSGQKKTPASKSVTPRIPPPAKKIGDSKSGPLIDPEITEMVNLMKKMHRDMELQLDDSYQRLGWTPRSIKEYLDNPGNFSNEEWTRIQTQRSMVIKRVENDLGIKINPERAAALKPTTVTAKTEKERRSKTRGARHNWIPIR